MNFMEGNAVGGIPLPSSPLNNTGTAADHQDALILERGHGPFPFDLSVKFALSGQMLEALQTNRFAKQIIKMHGKRLKRRAGRMSS